MKKRKILSVLAICVALVASSMLFASSGGENGKTCDEKKNSVCKSGYVFCYFYLMDGSGCGYENSEFFFEAN